ncbi:MAG TPA: PQQ-binding-like beta-propeller repeat protein [Bacteroidota bacterium]
MNRHTVQRVSCLTICAIVLACLGTVSVYGQDKVHFSFALVSDTHIGSSTAEEDLERTVHDLNSRNDVAFVIVSGDITEMGSNAQLILAKTILDSLRMPYHIIPGNHDAKWSESGCKEFVRLWNADRFTFEYDGYRFIGCASGPNMKMGDGHIPPEDLRWVDSVLTHLPNPGQPIVFVNHYPLDSELDNWYEIIGMLKRCNTAAILCGHGHANKPMIFEGIPGTMGRSNLRAKNPVGGYNLVELRNDTLFFSERDPGVGTKPPWRFIAVPTTPHSSDTTVYPRPDFSVNKAFPTVQSRWTVNTGYSIGSTPAVWHDLAYVGNSSGVMSAFALGNGTTTWTYRTNGAIYSSPAAANGKIVFGSSDCNIYCLNADDGGLLWKITTSAPVVASPVIREGVVFIGSSDSIFRAIDLGSGTIRWTYKGMEGFVETKPLVYDGMVIFGAWDTFLYALDERTGELLWKWSNGNPGRLFSPAACWPVASAGKVFIVAPDRYMTALDARSGKIVWRSSEHQVREMIGISEDSSRIYARLMNDSLLAFSAFSETPVLVWATDCKYGYDIDPSMPVECDGTVVFGTKNGLMIGVDARTGVLIWKHKLGNTIVNTLNPLSDRLFLTTTMDGIVSMVEVSGGVRSH